MNGLSEVARASGQRNLDNSAAAINLTQARDNQLDNYNKQVNTYFQTRAAHDAYVAAERGPRLTPEQMARIAKVGAVKPLSTLQLDPVYGKISWTSLLNTDQFADERKDLNELFRLRSYHGHLSFEEQTAVRKSTDKLIGKLKVIVRDVPSSDYTASKNFVTSLASMARMPAS